MIITPQGSVYFMSVLIEPIIIHLVQIIVLIMEMPDFCLRTYFFEL